MEEVKIIEEFLRVRPSGDGYGYGYGYGFGFSSGDGDGAGCGYGYGFGSGYGFGFGFSSGDGYGSGDGSGDDSGDGDGYGYGDGDGLKAFNGERVLYIDGVPTLIDQIKCNIAKGRIIKDDLTTEPCYIARVDNSFAHGKTNREALADATKKALEDMPVEKRIAKFKAEFPSLSKKAKCSEFYEWHHILTGSCTMGRDNFIKSHNLDMNKKYTVEYFLDITSGSYGKDIIKQLKESYT